jgi:hypothetical protein
VYLIGLLIWTLATFLVAWVLGSLLTRRVKARWLRRVVILGLLPLVFMAPLADEIVGKYQFDRLCEEAKDVKIHGAIAVGEELYTPDGKWRLDIPDQTRDLKILVDSYFRWEHGGSPPDVVPSVAIPIYRHNVKIYEKTSNRLLAEWKMYSTSGGWLSQQFETPALVRATCEPVIVQEGVYKRLVRFHKPEHTFK